tara:strand:+ start:22775 stop:23284 length:510 start_codon:yes stop_codon:yes gene_type:complete
MLQTYAEVQYERAHRYRLSETALWYGQLVRVVSIQGTGLGYGAQYVYTVRDSMGQKHTALPDQLDRAPHSPLQKLPDLDLPGEGAFDLVQVTREHQGCTDPMCCGEDDRPVWCVRDVESGELVDFEYYPEVLDWCPYDRGVHSRWAGTGFDRVCDAAEALAAMVSYLES